MSSAEFIVKASFSKDIQGQRQCQSVPNTFVDSMCSDPESMSLQYSHFFDAAASSDLTYTLRTNKYFWWWKKAEKMRDRVPLTLDGFKVSGTASFVVFSICVTPCQLHSPLETPPQQRRTTRPVTKHDVTAVGFTSDIWNSDVAIHVTAGPQCTLDWFYHFRACRGDEMINMWQIIF